MTCSELKDQENTLRAQADTLLSTISANQSNANLQFASCLAADTYGPVYPSSPPTIDNIGTRINYLMSLNPPPSSLIMSYQSLLALLQGIYTEQQALAQTNSMLGSVLQQEAAQGC